jgi:hypothetical protein
LDKGVAARVVKVVGGATAVLSLIFGIRQGAIYIADMRQRNQRAAELLSIADLQRQSNDYRAAWASLAEASLLRTKNDSVQRARENLAMIWLENAASSQGLSLAAIGDSAALVLSRGAITAQGPRRADLLAHLGWSEFLRWRGGERQLDPAARYRQALEADAQNPYANAMLGHWLLWNERDRAITDANRHFAAALASRRDRRYVRGMAFAAFGNVHTPATDLEMLRIANEMRTANETIDKSDRDRLHSVYARLVGSSFSRKPDSLQLAGVITAADVILTYRWLYEQSEWARSEALQYNMRLARLQEATSDSASALESYHAARREALAGSRYFVPVIDTAITRLSRR